MLKMQMRAGTIRQLLCGLYIYILMGDNPVAKARLLYGLCMHILSGDNPLA